VGVVPVVVVLLRWVCVGVLLGEGQAHSQEPPEREVSDRKRMIGFTWRWKSQQQQQQQYQHMGSK
jgi:hypothetical protein